MRSIGPTVDVATALLYYATGEMFCLPEFDKIFFPKPPKASISHRVKQERARGREREKFTSGSRKLKIFLFCFVLLRIDAWTRTRELDVHPQLYKCSCIVVVRNRERGDSC